MIFQADDMVHNGVIIRTSSETLPTEPEMRLSIEESAKQWTEAKARFIKEEEAVTAWLKSLPDQAMANRVLEVIDMAGFYN